MEKGIQTHMAQGRSTKIISMIKWIRTSRCSIKNSLSWGVTFAVGPTRRLELLGPALARLGQPSLHLQREREFLINTLLVRIHLII